MRFFFQILHPYVRCYFLADYNDGFVPGKLQPKKILQGEGIWMIFKFAFIEFKSENYLSHCHNTNYFAEKQVVKM